MGSAILLAAVGLIGGLAFLFLYEHREAKRQRDEKMASLNEFQRQVDALRSGSIRDSQQYQEAKAAYDKKFKNRLVVVGVIDGDKPTDGGGGGHTSK